MSKADVVSERILGLRTCRPDGLSYNDFQWVLEVGAEVRAPDWNTRVECGHGLHFLPWGEGNGELLDWSEDVRWLVVEVEQYILIDSAKAKAPSAIVRYVGERQGAVDYLLANGAQGRVIVGGTATAGDEGTATAGYGGTATAGYRGTATAGDSGTATAGYGGTATAGDRGTATAGDEGTATAGDRGTATAGYGGTATAGVGGTATAGDEGTATAGDEGTATAGDRGTVTAGDRGTVAVRWWDAAKGRYRLRTADIGEDGFEANVPYHCDEQGNLVRVAVMAAVPA